MTPFLKLVANDLYDRFGNDLRHVAVVFNNKRPIVFLKKYLATVIEKPIWSPSFFTIQEFIEQSSDLVVADFIPKFFLLHEAYNELLMQEGKVPLAYEAFFGLAETILNDFDQIDYELVSPGSVFYYLRDVAQIEQQFSTLSPEQQSFLKSFWGSFSTEKHAAVQQKFLELWNRLPALYSSFRKKMKDAGIASSAMQYRGLAEDAAARMDFINDYTQVAFVGFNALSQCERQLFRFWQEKGKALFYFDGDRYYFEDTHQEAGLFLRKNIKHYGLINALGAFPSEIAESFKEVAVYPVTGNVTQAKALAKIVEKGNGSAISDANAIAVLLADESLLIPVLQTIPKEIPLNVTMGFPLRQSALYGFLELWLSVQQQLNDRDGKYIRKEDALSYWTHPLSGADRAVAAERIKKINRVTTPEISVTLLEGAEEMPLPFFDRVTSAMDLLVALKDLLQHLIAQKETGGTLHLIESNLIYATYKVINQLQDGMQPFVSRLPVAVMTRFIQKALAGLAAPLEGEPLQGLQVMGMLESRCLDFEEVILLGANEGVLPSLSMSATFIPESLRRAFGLPVMENQDALSAYLFYRLLQRAKKIHIVYNAVTDKDHSGEPSRFLQQIQFETKLPVTVFTQKQPMNRNTSSVDPLCIEKSPAVMAVLHEYLQEYGSKKYLSASALKLYLQCPLQFFYKYIARIKEPEPVRDILDQQHIGTMLHRTLELFYAEFIGQTVRASMIEEKQQGLAGLVLDVMSQYIYNEPDRIRSDQMDSIQQIAHNILLENVRLVLNYDRHRVAPFTILDLENDRDYHCFFPVETDNRTYQVGVNAIIDRVDRTEILRIVDYKSGGDQLAMKSVDELFQREESTNLAAFQALFYSLIYQKIRPGENAVPQLYILRRLQKEGSSLGYLKGNRLHPFTPEAIAEMMVDFEENLKNLLAEIFDPGIPFMHQPKGKHYANNPYALFCDAG